MVNTNLSDLSKMGKISTPNTLMKDSHKVFKNFAIIGLSYSSNLLIPLLLIPHFINKLGIEMFGVVALAQSLMSYMNVIVDYHFATITVKEISINRDNLSNLNILFCRSVVIRLLLLIVTILFVTIITIIYPPFKSHYQIVLLSFAIVAGQAVLPNWFLLGIEDIGAIAILNIVFKGIYIILTLTLVEAPEDALFPNFFLGITNIFAGISGCIYIFRKFHFRILFPDFMDIKNEFIKGRLMTVSNISVSIYTSSSPIILALFYSPTMVGEYIAAERILGIFRGLSSVFFQATYSRAASLMLSGKEVLSKFYKDIFPYVIFSVLLACTIFFLDAKQIMYYIFRISNPVITDYVRYMMIIIVIIMINIPYYQRLLIVAPHKANVVILMGCVISIVLNFLFIPFWGAIGCIISIALTELYITIGLYIQNVRNKLL